MQWIYFSQIASDQWGQASVTVKEILANPSDQLAGLYREMLLIRRSEEALITMFADGEVPGFIHLGIGQEAVPVGVMYSLGAEDTIASTHRGHGHAIAKGLPLEGFFAELLGRETGLCKGRGGSMHVADMTVGMLGANGIVGAGSAIALGSALAHKTLGRNAIAVAFFGDGALAEGLMHECMNMASLLKLPLLLACENNGWSEFSPTVRQIAFSLSGLADAHKIPYMFADGNDVEDVVEKAAAAIAWIREGKGPYVLECQTTRVRGHFEGDAQKYRGAEEFEALDACDPIRIAGERLLLTGFDEHDIAGFIQDVERQVAAAISSAREGGAPKFSDAIGEVYTLAAAD